jgi:hypothetical protein
VLVDILGNGILVHEILKQCQEKFSSAKFNSVLHVSVVDEFGEVLIHLAYTLNVSVVVTDGPVELGYVVLKALMGVRNFVSSAPTFERAFLRAFKSTLFF